MKKHIAIAVWILLVLTSIALINCSDEDVVNPPDPENNVIMPLATGNTWNYVDSVWIAAVPQSFPATMVVTGDTTVTIGTTPYDVFKLRITDSVFGEPSVLFMRNESDGLWNLGTRCANSEETNRNLYAKYPASAGDMWVKNWQICSSGDPSSNGVDTVTVVSSSSRIVTPAGDYLCVRYLEQYDTPFGRFEVEHWMAPNIGIVATDMNVMGIILKRRLTGYTTY